MDPYKPRFSKQKDKFVGTMEGSMIKDPRVLDSTVPTFLLQLAESAHIYAFGFCQTKTENTKIDFCFLLEEKKFRPKGKPAKTKQYYQPGNPSPAKGSEVRKVVGTIDDWVDAAVEHRREQHAVRHKNRNLGIIYNLLIVKSILFVPRRK